MPKKPLKKQAIKISKKLVKKRLNTIQKTIKKLLTEHESRILGVGPSVLVPYYNGTRIALLGLTIRTSTSP